VALERAVGHHEGERPLRAGLRANGGHPVHG
jgi:hypothetical protein